MPTFRKFNTTVFDQDSGRRKGKPGTLSALQGASRIPFSNMIVAAAAGWQLYKYVKHRFFKKPQQPSQEGEEDQDAQDPAQQQSLEQVRRLLAAVCLLLVCCARSRGCCSVCMLVVAGSQAQPASLSQATARGECKASFAVHLYNMLACVRTPSVAL